MMIEPFLIALIMLMFKGYKLKTICRLKVVWVFMAISVASIALSMVLLSGIVQINNSAKIILKLSSIILMSGLIIIYRDSLTPGNLFKYMLVALTGILCNNIVIWANNGCMPVKPIFNYNKSLLAPKAGYILADENTKLLFLGDIIDVKYEIYSIGDIFIILFVSIMIYTIIRSAIMKTGWSDAKYQHC